MYIPKLEVYEEINVATNHGLVKVKRLWHGATARIGLQTVAFSHNPQNAFEMLMWQIENQQASSVFWQPTITQLSTIQ